MFGCDDFALILLETELITFLHPNQVQVQDEEEE